MSNELKRFHERNVVDLTQDSDDDMELSAPTQPAHPPAMDDNTGCQDVQLPDGPPEWIEPPLLDCGFSSTDIPSRANPEEVDNWSPSRVAAPSSSSSEASTPCLSEVPPWGHQKVPGDKIDDPWDALNTFLTIDRACFSSGKDFLRECETLRLKILAGWKLQFTKKFTNCHLIKAMRSYDPSLASVLRAVQLEDQLGFAELKKIILESDVTDDIMVGSKTWGQWKAENSSGTSSSDSGGQDYVQDASRA
ncbi:hypothetical protein NUW58_g2613 [Xylaria curta]|uniref:Uncharacterized protein n=1 Tax=Xylaria curta TaxID=42375 RepID=A0ACC1PEP7_9PEZI|nr:hypothetical protein NUW58_g2613 [Xylaria curta]